MKPFSVLFKALLIALLLYTAVLSLGLPAQKAAADHSVDASATSTKDGYQTGFTLWHASGTPAGFDEWATSGIVAQQDGLALDLASAVDGAEPYPNQDYYGHYFYNGGVFRVGEALSPVLPVSFDFTEAIASWNAETPSGTWVEVLVRAQMGQRWSKWYNLGVWAADNSAIQRHSVRLQGDADGYVAVDTLVLAKGKVPASALQLKVRLFSQDQISVPVLRAISLAYSGQPAKKVTPSAGNPALWGVYADAPKCSQMVYPDGGNVWCSPTSTAMVLGYYQDQRGDISEQDCADLVLPTVNGVYDWLYNGHGNWPFNTAYAASLGYDAYVRRYTSLAELEPLTHQGIPVILSIAWKKGQLTGASIPASNGHLIVLLGFDENGNAVVNDPAFDTNGQVRTTYNRQELENIWQINSGGTVYVIYPPAP